MRVDVDVRGERETADLLEGLAGRLDDGRPQLRGLLSDIMVAQAGRFAGRGTRWRKAAPSTVVKDRQEHRDPRLLVLTGRLMASLTVPGDPDQRVTIRPGELRFGTRVFYARFHKRGDGVPKRAPAGLTRVQRSELVDHLKRLLLTRA